MTSRMTAQDASYYYLETSNTPMHVGSLAILEPPEGGLDYESVLRLVEQRLPEVPRYRKKVREVAFGLSRPVWVDDRDFDITYHVRRSALPKPGSDEQLHDLVARLVSRPLDRTRPLWEMYLVEGLANDRVALFTKSHSALVDAVGRIARTAAQSAPETPLNTQISRSRRFSVVRSDLEPYRKIHSRYGCTINDVVLAVLAGALRYWLLSRGEPVTEATVVRAMVPMSVYTQDPDDCGDNDTIQVHPQGEVSSFLLDLPVGEPNAVVRLSHIAHAGEAYSRQRRRVAAQTMVRLSGFAPATMHAVGARVAMGFSQRMFNLMITNAPGPQHPLYLTGARLLEIFPVSPLLKNQALSIALTSYDGKIYYGLNADRDAMPDVDVAATLIQESLEELTDAGR
ncbi:wax ester/triacylglycerol synthase family O-acyltransferase [Rhodococcus sp. LW-XY12]|uniref:WS/DGAT/MGAT family O-acyltransferase n=1 Tax=Rhodococcus sp. LW-XY12 TaxID=2856851 RepID=UPI001C5A381F|nr:wax ester/triacylglycerol synthase family O-acyltransferase [Rhodococcus sp. LW-XY12]QXU52407.1 wax ester/triacylglycerol synthase family O-acyltransferase [Rhodococcus sp. LW-XY12]